jgi:hypothetical protein
MSIRFDRKSLADFEKRIQRAARWSLDDRKELVKIGKDVGQIYVRKARQLIRDHDGDIIIKRGGSTTIVPKGALRRSMGTWRSSRDSGVVLAGPRAGFLGRKVSPRNDGWFAHIVEGGQLPSAFGGRSSSPNVGVFTRALAASEGAMKTVRNAKLQSAFKKFNR